jgi:membrane protein DedA with SNARE-associated domain
MEISIDAILDLARAYAPGLVFTWMALENILFLGFVVPGLTVLVVTGLLIHTGDVAPGPVLGAAVLGTYVGDTANYALGRWGLRRLGWVRRVITENEEARRFIERYPKALYVFFHFPVYLRSAFPLTLGSLNYSWRAWLGIDLVAAPLFVAAFVGLGYGLGRYVLRLNDLTVAVQEISRIGNGVILVFSLLFAYGTYKFVRTVWRTARRDEADDCH